jgi:antirestriction protein ArdC
LDVPSIAIPVMTNASKEWSMTDTSKRADVHEIVTQRIIAMLETAKTNGAVMPWCRPGVAHSRPTNAATDKPYRGINILSLWAAAQAANYRTGLWATFKQWQQLGASVRKGEKATPIVFYKSLDIDDGAARDTTADDDIRTIRIARGYWGFNADQVDGFTIPDLPTETLVKRIDRIEAFIAATGADVRIGGARACYRPTDDVIQMPDLALFRETPQSTATEAYYAVLGHELGHWTGAKTRLARELSTRFGSASYAMEEMIAEWTSGFLCADLAITAQPRDDHAHYIGHWLEVLKGDKSAVFAAAAQASRAVEYLHGLQPDTASSASRQHYIDTGRYLTAAERE